MGASEPHGGDRGRRGRFGGAGRDGVRAGGPGPGQRRVASTPDTQVRNANADLLAANDRERARFNLAMDAVGLFHGEVSEDLLLKEKPVRGAADQAAAWGGRLLRQARGLLKGQTDRASRRALGRAYDELGELTDKIGSKPEALAVHGKALAVRRELAEAPRG